MEYIEEQRRLFYVSITRPKKTLVLSRALNVKRGPARQMGLKVTSGSPFWANLTMSPFLEDILSVLPDASLASRGAAASRNNPLCLGF